MKKHGHLNRDIARILALMGHGDSLVIADCGLPIPPGVECIDLALQLGRPGFDETLDSILADFQCERAVFAVECQMHNEAARDKAEALARAGVALEFVSHEELKRRSHSARAVIRTGECTPYANAILHSGVIF
ncbi:D-ribose pyranase [Chromobacterium sp. ATCC 53434]|uniref:D-ribose pyranase n=1 Tax=Chromobacterium sp. (strain ATCC 53434 / SC 14030) TaxID=2059672 RepID=UPI000C76139A|nr:D-ribose pyranase [Chromobacterium sp. ATCC 53434]AUH50465.1 D-ribose pyranase [Chromobacterium sp. ATCC 53434]